MNIARFACAFCMNEVKDFANAEKLGWKSKSARLLNGDIEPPPGSVEFLRLMQESRNTKKVLAQLYPRQATKRMQQAAMIAKAEIEFIKYVHGEASEEYLDILIETGNYFCRFNRRSGKLQKHHVKCLKRPFRITC